eukprot:m.741690 g.741690  ORF g.741690 m.741690 type:complete len:960 (+) comp23116_c4_seq1:51-2930(+)
MEPTTPTMKRKAGDTPPATPQRPNRPKIGEDGPELPSEQVLRDIPQNLTFDDDHGGALSEDDTDTDDVEITANFGANPNEIEIDSDSDDEASEMPSDTPETILAADSFNEDMSAGAVVFLHFDIEVTSSSDQGSICQLSCCSYYNGNSEIEKREFNAYVTPPSNAEWSEAAIATHGLRPHDFKVGGRQFGSKLLVDAWADWVSWIDDVLSPDVLTQRTGCLVCWGGTACEAKWLYLISEIVHPGVCHLPRQVKYFWNPLAAATKYQGCTLHKSKLGTIGTGLAEVHSKVMSTPDHSVLFMPGAHDSMVDCRNQMEAIHKEFVYIRGKKVRNNILHYLTLGAHNKTASKTVVEYLSGVMSAKAQKYAKRTADVNREVPEGWNDKDDSPRSHKKYRGPAAGPTSKGIDAVKSMETLIKSVFPWELLDEWALYTNKYAREDWVRPAQVDFRKGSVLTRCSSSDDGARHRFETGQSHKKWHTVTGASILCFIGIMVAAAAQNVRCQEFMWSNAYGTDIAWARNAMPLDAFLQHRRYLAFGDYSAVPKRGDARYDPLFRIQSVVKAYQQLFRSLWTLGEFVSVDESMIKYSGRAIDFVQYMPAKPIKHGIKVFALCCSATAYAYSFSVYTGKDGCQDAGVIHEMDKLTTGCDFENQGSSYRTMFTDNWYTSLALASWLFSRFSMYLVGTIRLTKKLSRTAVDFPFHKFSASASKNLVRGFMRRAIMKMAGVVTYLPKHLYAQAIIWRDKKIVGFLSTCDVGPAPAECTVLRWNKVTRSKEGIAAHPVVHKYVKNMGGVDQMDRDITDWGTHGRYRYQMDLAQTMIKMALERDWDFDADVDRPEWMRSKTSSWVPCKCKTCFHCVHNLTSGHVTPIVKVTPGRGRRKSVVTCGTKSEIARKSKLCGFCYMRIKQAGVAAGIVQSTADIKRQRNHAVKKCCGCNRYACGMCWTAHVEQAPAAQLTA